MSQHVLGEDEAVPDGDAADPPPTSEERAAPRPPVPPAPSAPLPPSDLELRRRQLAWFAERARYERARRGRVEGSDGP